MSSRHVEVCIIGQGLAGTTLAWTMLLRGKSVLVIDSEIQSTASRIAAGLITPITGPKLAKTQFWDECRQCCEEFYRVVEQKVGAELFANRPAIHIFRSENESELFQRRMLAEEYQQLARPLAASEFPPQIQAPWGGFEMPGAARLNVSSYLDLSRDFFRQLDSYLSIEIHPSIVQPTPTAVLLPSLQVSAETVYFCQGFHPDVNPWFNRIRFQPAKGEVLSLRIPSLQKMRSMHSGVWLAPMPDETYSLGSTFEWKQLDAVPTPAARDQLLTQVQHWLSCPMEVVEQRAAVRPTMHDFKPVIGRHPEEPRLGILNGLGTKGSLMAPWLAELVADQLEHQKTLPADLDVRRWFR